jgi:hypothetical protein
LRLLLAVAISVALWLSGPVAAEAAEVLQVRTSTLLQVGDGNRNYSVQLACIQVDPDQEAKAIGWLRAELPRRSRVNLRPMGQDKGVLVASVQKLGAPTDLASGLVAEGLAQASCGSSTTING